MIPIILLFVVGILFGGICFAVVIVTVVIKLLGSEKSFNGRTRAGLTTIDGQELSLG